MIRNIEVKILNKKAKLPEYSTEGSAAVDLIACIDRPMEIAPNQVRLIGTGLAISMQKVPELCASLILPRSGKGHKEGKVLGNLVGLIDEDYHGELMVSLWNRNEDVYVTIEPGERFAQLMFVPIIRANFKEVQEFSSTTERGIGGFGSTGG